MKCVVKNAEPQELLAWKAADKMYQRGRANYNRIPGEIKLFLILSLQREQGNICCYCERPLTEGDCHVEHIMPQTDYMRLSCDYNNMLCSCQQNIPKGEPKHCGMSKGDWYDETLFISPLDPGCESRFSYTFDGQILPSQPTDQSAIATIDKCNLYVSKLKSLRESVIETFTDPSLSDNDLKVYVQSYLTEKENNNNSYNAFFTTIKYLFGHLSAE